MSQWPSIKAKRLLAALFGIGWKLKRQSGSHRKAHWHHTQRSVVVPFRKIADAIPPFLRQYCVSIATALVTAILFSIPPFNLRVYFSERFFDW